MFCLDGFIEYNELQLPVLRQFVARASQHKMAATDFNSIIYIVQLDQAECMLPDDLYA